MSDPSEADFVITRLFKAPRERVWDAWTQPEQFVRWFGPKGCSITLLRFELRPGGVLHSRMDTPDGNSMFARFVYREVVPPARLVWEHGFADAAGERARAPFPGFPLEMLTTVLFEAAPGGTQVTLRWSPIAPTPEERATFDAAKPGMTGGWNGSFEQLDGFLATPA